MITWEKLPSIEAGSLVRRAKVPGGWLVFVAYGGGQAGVTFYPDPDHTWDGSSLPYSLSGQKLFAGTFGRVKSATQRRPAPKPFVPVALSGSDAANRWLRRQNGLGDIYVQFPGRETTTASSTPPICLIDRIVSEFRFVRRSYPGHIVYLCQVMRKRVETTFSAISEHFSRSIHAVTARGFELKVFLTVLAYSILG